MILQKSFYDDLLVKIQFILLSMLKQLNNIYIYLFKLLNIFVETVI